MFEKLLDKKIIPAIALVFTIVVCQGQDIHYSNNYENFYNLNPSSITNIKNSAFIGNYRNQWPGSADFVNYSAAFFITFKDFKSTLGTQLIRDNQGNGIITNTGIALFYAYRTKISNNIIISAGLGGIYNMYALNTGSLTFEDNQSTINFNNQKKKYFDFLSGIELEFNKSNILGASVSHITSPQINTETSLPVKLTFNYQGKYSLMNPYSFRKIFLEPIIVSSIQSNANEIFYGSKINIQGIAGGLFLRNDNNFNFDSFIILLGISFGNVTVNYTYDINLSGSQSRFNKLASHEVTFFYNLEYNIGRNKKKAIKCPKI